MKITYCFPTLLMKQRAVTYCTINCIDISNDVRVTDPAGALTPPPPPSQLNALCNKNSVDVKQFRTVLCSARHNKIQCQYWDETCES